MSDGMHGPGDPGFAIPEASYGGYPDLSRLRRVLVVKLRNHGDVLLSTPVFRALREALPDARIDAFINRETLPMLEGNPDVNGFVLLDRAARHRGLAARIGEEWRLRRALRSGSYDAVINLTEGDRGRIAGRLAGARVRVGFAPRGRAVSGYTHVVKQAATPRHAVERNLDALRRIGIFPPPEARALRFAIPNADRAAVRARLAAAGLAPGGFVHVHPASRWRFKTWPAERVAEVVLALAARGLRCVLTAAPDAAERAMAARIATLAAQAQPVDLAGELTLKQLGAVMDEAAVLLTVDSVPLHMASALQRPVVALFGPSSELEWGPWNHPRAEVIAAGFTCRPCGLDGCGGGKVSECLVRLPAARVVAALERLLENENP